MLRRITSLVIKDCQQFIRDKVLISFVILGPTFQLVLLGQGTGAEPAHLPMAVLDEDRSSASRALLASLDRLEELDTAHHLDRLEEAGPLLDRGEITVAVVLRTMRRFAGG